MVEIIKMQSTGQRQQFTWKNEIVKDLISNIENFQTLRLKASISSETDKHKKRSYRKNYAKNIRGLGKMSFTKL